MKRLILFILLSVFLSRCTAVLKNSGYSAENLVNDHQCESFSYNLDSVAYWKRLDIMGPLIPLFPSRRESKTYGLYLKAGEGVELDNTFCPTLKINGEKQVFDSFTIERGRCSYNLLEAELGEEIKLEVEHSNCESLEINLEKYKKWDYVPPFMLTV